MKDKQKNLYVLRDGDLLPEPVGNFRYYTSTFIGELDKCGLLFHSREEAMRASVAVRRYLLGLGRQDTCERSYTPSHIHRFFAALRRLVQKHHD